jgi:hypothetical protein
MLLPLTSYWEGEFWSNSRLFLLKNPNTLIEFLLGIDVAGFMLSEKKARGEEYFCAVPTVEILSKTENLSKVLDSHAWEVRKSETYGDDGILLFVQCKNCGLKRISIISDIKDSAKKRAATRSRKE